MIPGEIIVAKAAADEYPMNLGFLGKGNCTTLLPPAVRRARAGEVFHLPFLRQRRSGALRALHWAKRLSAVKNTRKITKRDLLWNDTLPKLEVDPETYTVKADGRVLTCEPAKVLPMAQRYFLF